MLPFLPATLLDGSLAVSQQRILEQSGKLNLLDQLPRPHPAFRWLFSTTNTIGLRASGLYHGTQQINQGQMMAGRDRLHAQLPSARRRDEKVCLPRPIASEQTQGDFQHGAGFDSALHEQLSFTAPLISFNSEIFGDVLATFLNQCNSGDTHWWRSAAPLGAELPESTAKLHVVHGCAPANRRPPNGDRHGRARSSPAMAMQVSYAPGKPEIDGKL